MSVQQWANIYLAHMFIYSSMFAAMLTHFVRLLYRAWNNMTSATSTNTLGFILWTLALTAVGWGATVAERWLELKREKALHPLRTAIYGSIWPGGALLAGGVGGLVVIAFFVSCVWTVYNDHQNQAATILRLQHDIPAKDQEIRALKEKLTEICYMPDRRLTPEKRDVLYTSLKATAEKYHHPRIATGYFDGDMESERFRYQIYLLFKDAGFDVEKNAIFAPQRKQSTDPPSPGFVEGLSIQVESDTPPTPAHPHQQIVMAIFQDFVDAEVEMRQYPVGPGNAVKSSDRIIIWVGIKNVDWLTSMKRP